MVAFTGRMLIRGLRGDGLRILGGHTLADHTLHTAQAGAQLVLDQLAARNLLTVCAHKSLQLSQRILHTSSKSIRGRLMSYFSECAKHAGSNSFLIPYNRQQLADYLNVDRSTMCNELSKMQKDGMIEYKKNRILLKD